MPSLQSCCELLGVRPPNPGDFTNYAQACEALDNWKSGALKKAFRKAAKAAHPDRGGSDARMCAVNDAYALLNDDLCVLRPRPKPAPQAVFRGFSTSATTATTSSFNHFGGQTVTIIIQ